jgi:predicted DNA-binding antitoxin AbrB/MazE fold protein
MSLILEAIYEKGVFVPVHEPALSEHEHVRLHVESIPPGGDGVARINRRRANRIRLNAELAAHIGTDEEFHPDNG